MAKVDILLEQMSTGETNQLLFCNLCPYSSITPRENLNNREGQSDSTRVDKYCLHNFTWTTKGV